MEERFRGWDLTAEEAAYLAYHADRYARLMALVERLGGPGPEQPGVLGPRQVNGPRTPGRSRPAGRVLDVGAGFETVLLRDRFGEENVDVLGLWVPRFASSGAGEHFPVDLNEIDKGLPEMRPYDLIVAAEVIEHLERGPATVMSALAGLLAPGGRLVLQTPNAAAMHKRLRLLAGRAPFEPMPEDRSGDGHVREYTVRELVEAAAAAGLRPAEVTYANYAGGGRGRDVLARAGRFMPRSLRLGLSLVLERQP